ncbi:MAG: patatin, partial [Calditrichaeota bacterium]
MKGIGGAVEGKVNLRHRRNLPAIGLALSGGATRGVAHIGVLKALEEHFIKPDYIAGTSIGALVGAVYAFGVPLNAILDQALQMSWSTVSRLSLSRAAILTNKAIAEIVEKHIGAVNIEEAPIPLAIIATDIATGEKVVLRQGNVAHAVMASTAIPGIYAPVKMDGRLLVDGFLVENVPISPLKAMGTDIIVGVHLSSQKMYREPTGIVNIIMNAFEIAVDANTQANLRDADVLITPNLAEDDRPEEESATFMYEEGYRAALRVMPRLLQL